MKTKQERNSLFHAQKHRATRKSPRRLGTTLGAAAVTLAFMFGSAPASAGLVTYTTAMAGFTYNSDVVSGAFNSALGSPYTHISFSGASSTDGTSYSPLVTFSTKVGTFGGSNTGQVNASNEIGPFGSWDGILNVDFATNDIGAVGFGLVEFTTGEVIRVYDDTDSLIGTFSNSLGGTFSLWGVATTAGERIGRVELDGNFFAIQDISFSSVPEPATALLFGIGLMGLGALRRRGV